MPYFTTSPNTNNNNNNVPASSSQEDQAKAQKQQQHAASVQPKHHELPRTEAPTVLRSPSKQEADSRDNEINSRRGTSTDEHSMHKGASVQSKHHELPRTEAPTVLRLPSKQEDDHSSWDNEIIARGTTHDQHPEHKEGVVLSRIPSKDDQAVRNDFAVLRSGHPTRPAKREADLSDNERPRGINNIIEARVHKEVGHVPARIPSKDQQPAKNFDGVKEQSRIEYQERKEADMPAKDQAPLTSLRQQEHDRPKDNGGVTNRPADPPVNNPIININVYLTDHQQPKSVDKNDAIKENNVKPANNLEKKTDAESSCCERCKKLCSIL